MILGDISEGDKYSVEKKLNYLINALNHHNLVPSPFPMPVIAFSMSFLLFSNARNMEKERSRKE